MVLDEKRDARFDQMIQKYEEEKTMVTLSPYQKRFIAKGKQEGLQDGLREALLLTLTVRFERISDDLRAALNQIEDHDTLTRLQQAAVQAATMDEFRSLLAP